MPFTPQTLRDYANDNILDNVVANVSAKDVRDGFLVVSDVIEAITDEGILAASLVAQEAAEAAALYAPAYYKDPATFFADSTVWPVGTRINARTGEVWDVVSSGQHFLHPVSGIKLKATVVAGEYNLLAFGNIGDDATVNTAAMQAAMRAATADGTPLLVPDGIFRSGAVTGLGSSPLIMRGPGRIKCSGSDVTFCSPLGDVDVTGVEFENFMKVFDFASVPANAKLSWENCNFIACGNTATGAGRVDFQGAITAPTTANAIKSLSVKKCSFTGEDFGIAYQGPFTRAVVDDCDFSTMRRMGVMLGNDNGGDWSPFVYARVANCTFTDIIGNDSAEYELHGVLAYGQVVVVSDNICTTCYDIHASIHDSEMIYVRAEKAIVTDNFIKNGGRGDGHLSVKGGDRSTVSGNIILSDTYAITGIYLDGVSNSGRVIATDNQLIGVFDRGILINGAGKACGNRLEGLFSYAIMGLLDASTGAALVNPDFDFTDNTIIQTGAGAAGILVRVDGGYTLNFAGIKGNNIRLGSSGTLTHGIQLEAYRVASGNRNTISHADVGGNYVAGRSGATPNAFIANTDSGSGATGGLISRVTYHDNDSDFCDNVFRVAVVTTGDVATADVDGGLNTNFTNRLLSSPTSISTLYCRNVRGLRRSETSGTATISSGNTSITVAMGLQDTLRPTSLKSITVTPTSANGSATEWWVDTLTGDNFTIRCDVAPGGSGFTFAWRAVNLYFD